MKKRFNLALIALIAMALIIAGCAKTKSPSDVVKEFFNDLKNNKIAEAQKFISAKDLEEYKKAKLNVTDDLKQFAAQLKQVKYDRVQVTKTDIKGNNATVEFKVFFNDKDKKEQSDKFKLIKEKNQWKITVTS